MPVKYPQIPLARYLDNEKYSTLYTFLSLVCNFETYVVISVEDLDTLGTHWQSRATVT